MIHNRLKIYFTATGLLVAEGLEAFDWRLSQLGFDPSYGKLICLATLMSSDRTKQICLWDDLYIYTSFLSILSLVRSRLLGGINLIKHCVFLKFSIILYTYMCVCACVRMCESVGLVVCLCVCVCWEGGCMYVYTKRG